MRRHTLLDQQNRHRSSTKWRMIPGDAARRNILIEMQMTPAQAACNHTNTRTEALHKGNWCCVNECTRAYTARLVYNYYQIMECCHSRTLINLQALLRLGHFLILFIVLLFKFVYNVRRLCNVLQNNLIFYFLLYRSLASFFSLKTRQIIRESLQKLAIFM